MGFPSVHRSPGLLSSIVVVLLCLCVVVHMLGVPATLLDPAGAPDTMGHSVLEGFSVPPSLVQISPSTQAEPAPDIQKMFTSLVLTAFLFHPPVPWS